MEKIALVTGATSKLGQEIINELSREGYFVYATMSRLDKNNISSPIVKIVQLDITDTRSVKNLVKKVIKDKGKLDVLVNVAGITINGSIVETSEESFMKMLDVNVMGAFRTIKGFIPLLKKSTNARVVNITSMAGVASFPNSAAYCASKHAMEALGQGIRPELIKNSIWVTNIAPGAIASDKIVKLDFKPMREKYALVKLFMPMVTKEKVANSVIRVLRSKNPPARILLGNDTKLVNLAKKILPNNLWDRLVLFMWK